jgi:hydrogenase nickel incorporation protein HypA/HybF
MHEIRLATDLAGIVTEVALRENLKLVTRVNLQFGEMIQIVPDIFRFAFSEAVKGSVAENAGIELEIIPVTLRCTHCHKEFVIKDLVFRCDDCHSVELDIIHGKEMFVKSLEGEHDGNKNYEKHSGPQPGHGR